MMRMIGPIIAARRVPAWRLRDVSRQAASRLSAMALCLSEAEPISWRGTDGEVGCPAAGGLLLDLSVDGQVSPGIEDDGLVLILPRRLMSSLVPGTITAIEIPGSAALGAVRRLAAGVLHADASFSEIQAQLIGRAIAELLTVALASCSDGGTGVASRREASLLDRVVDHVDRHLGEPLDVAAICMAVHCSRSALYRATGVVGGVAVLVNQRRLSAVHQCLLDQGERASIAALARRHGFPDPASFSRSFKRRYRVTAAELRRMGRRSGDVDRWQ